MSRKRSIDQLCEESQPKHVKFSNDDAVKKHTLDSDEEDIEEDQYNILPDNDIEGEEEESTNRQDGETRMTAFNMQEEMEMGHFDRDGHFIWKNEKEVRDNWLDNIDWQRVEPQVAEKHPQGSQEESSDSETDAEDPASRKKFNEMDIYKRIQSYLLPGESINKALRRHGGDLSKLSSVERLKRKKAGTLQASKEVTELTALANQILTQKGHMDIYQETYDSIRQKLAEDKSKRESKANVAEAALDMYAEDFGTKESLQKKQQEAGNSSLENKSSAATKEEQRKVEEELQWEFKWDQSGDQVEGPFSSGQMNRWNREGRFKKGVWVRKCGSLDANFYSSARIDFELYL